MTRARTVLSFAHRTAWPRGTSALEASLGRFDRQDRRPVAVVITTDGRRAALVDLDLGPGLAGAVAVAGPRTDQQPGKGRAPRIVVRLLDGDAVLAALGGR